MNLDTFVAVLTENPLAALHLMLPDGSFVPAHFHVTEVGRVQKDFIDCGLADAAVDTLFVDASDVQAPSCVGETVHIVS